MFTQQRGLEEQILFIYCVCSFVRADFTHGKRGCEVPPPPRPSSRTQGSAHHVPPLLERGGPESLQPALLWGHCRDVCPPREPGVCPQAQAQRRGLPSPGLGPVVTLWPRSSDGGRRAAGGGHWRREEESYLGLPSCANSTLGLHQTGHEASPAPHPWATGPGGRGAAEETPAKPGVLGLGRGGPAWASGCEAAAISLTNEGVLASLWSLSLPRPGP